MLVGLSFLSPLFALALMVLGFVLIIAARIWMIVSAFGEDAGMGCLVIFLPWYGLWSLEDRRPLMLLGVGFLFLLSGIGVAVVMHALGA